ncbi:hypothetical protein DW745_04330 [Ruminococcus sp. AM28-29LB]|nr:hypothetical protein DW745_04330 [Ruminococcus sp. AM28-29LB]
MWLLYLSSKRKYRNYNDDFCRTTAKEKKPSYSRYISTRLCSGGFEKIRAAVSFCFSMMLMRSGGRYMGGYRHVNFRHS